MTITQNGSDWKRGPGHQLAELQPGETEVDPFVLVAELTNVDWQDDSLCAQTDPESFFPENGRSTKEAKQTCMACDVRAECLDWAIATEQKFGIWGGLSERERRALKQQLILGAARVAASGATRSDAGVVPVDVDEHDTGSSATGGAVA